jgi:hypothetical protein
MKRRAAVIDGREVRATSPIAIRARVGSLLTPRAALIHGGDVLVLP